MGSFLLFLVQPMVAKMLLPSLGGTPSVWNTAMVFFQVTLVAGYAIAHGGMRYLAPRVQRRLQIGLLALPLVALPVALPAGWRPPTSGSPALWTILVLAVAAGAPYLALSTCSPTIQHWFATSKATHGRSPYFLYAAGNAGSLLALLAYPVLIEPRLTIAGQARLFSIGYVVLVGLAALCALRRVADGVAPTRLAVEEPGPDEDDRPVDAARRLRWMAWAFIPSALMLGVTRHLTTDVMSVPMMWIVPLALYLLTFIIAFGRHTDRLVDGAGRALKLATIPLVVSLLAGSTSLFLLAGIHLVVFFVAALLGHARLAADRPAPRHLTEFYLWVSIGGAVGGAVTTLVAPLIFPTVIEYPLTVAAALAMVPGAGAIATRAGRRIDARAVVGALAIGAVAVAAARGAGSDEPRDWLIAGLGLGLAGVVAYQFGRSPRSFALAIGVLALVSIVPRPGTLETDRSFFGVSAVRVDPQTGQHMLMSGTTLHGRQDPADPGMPLTYYHPDGPLGHLMQRDAGPRDIGVVGLGAGSIAAYGQAGDTMTFYEIDPVVIRIAEDPDSFTFLADSAADVDIVVGDGRLNLERSDATYDVLALDAFSSDSIPLHLLTEEALTTYIDHLTPEGVLAIHISNRYFDLEPGLARLAHDLGVVGVVGDHHPSAEETEAGDATQRWVFIARDTDDLADLAADSDFTVLDPEGDGPRWTDDFSNILSALYSD